MSVTLLFATATLHCAMIRDGANFDTRLVRLQVSDEVVASIDALSPPESPLILTGESASRREWVLDGSDFLEDSELLDEIDLMRIEIWQGDILMGFVGKATRQIDGSYQFEHTRFGRCGILDNTRTGATQ
jgi:hypothetical protein